MSDRGLGSLTKLRGSWRARIYVDGDRLEYVSPKKSEAQRWLTEHRRAKLNRVPITADVTVADVIPEVQSRMQLGVERVYSPRTLASYAVQWKRLESALGTRRVSTLRPQDAQAWVAELREAGCSTSTVRHHLHRLAQVVRHAVDAGYLPVPPLVVRAPRPLPHTDPWCCSETELAKLVAAAKDDWDRRAEVAVLIAADAGLRVTEIAQLQVGDVDLDRGRLHVHSRGDDRTKTGHARSVPIHTDRLRAALAGLIGRPKEDRLLGVRDKEGVSGIARRAWQAALGTEPRWHGLRRRYATWRALAGDPVPIIQRRLGHATILTTERYIRLTGDEWGDGDPPVSEKARQSKRRGG